MGFELITDMKKWIIVCVALWLLNWGCTTQGALLGGGLYLDQDGKQSLMIRGDTAEITVVSRVLGEQGSRELHLRLQYVVRKDGIVQFTGSSNSKAYLSIATLYEWRIDGDQIFRKDVDSGEITVFRKSNQEVTGAG